MISETTLRGIQLAHNSENVFLRKEYILVATKLDIRTGVLAVENLVANTDFRSLTASVIVGFTRTNLDHFAHLRLFLRCVRKKDAACSLLLGFRDFYEDAVSKRFNGGDAEGNSCHE